MSLTIPNPTYATQGPAKTGQVLAGNEQTSMEVAFIGRTTITLDGSIVTGTINFIDGTQTVFSNSISQAYPNQGLGTVVAPVSVTASIVGGTQQAATAITGISTGTPTTTGFPFYLSAAGSNANTLTIQFVAYKL
jgi:hypothetical protein